jgi:hypothetical protein
MIDVLRQRNAQRRKFKNRPEQGEEQDKIDPSRRVDGKPLARCCTGG